MVRRLQSLFVVIGLLLASVFVIAGQAQQAGVASIGKFPALAAQDDFGRNGSKKF